MVLIRCRTFLGCLPLNSGVCVLALVALLLGGGGAVQSWMGVMLLGIAPLVFLRDLLNKYFR